jgi:hypothetical protein
MSVGWGGRMREGVCVGAGGGGGMRKEWNIFAACFASYSGIQSQKYSFILFFVYFF